MGWLRDFMNAVEPPVASFGQLAELCLSHPQWPADTRPKPRSLSTLFSKLDRSQELDWLRDRPDAQQVLAQLLRRPLGDVRLAVGESAAEGNPRVLRLHDVRFAREVDLAREELPPGIPAVCCTPPLWGPSWWLAPPGAGKSITAAWLKCRGLAHVTEVTSRHELAQLPRRGPLYIEWASSLRPDLGQQDLDALRAQHRPVLFASIHPAPPDLPIARIQSPFVLDYLPELVDWVGRHLDDTGHFQADRAELWIRRVAVPTGAAQSWGDVLGLLGMMDEVNPRSISTKSLDEVGEHFVTRRVQEATADSSFPQRLSQNAYAALLDCAARALVEGEHDLSGAHTSSTWTALLSKPQAEEGPDPEWFDVALRGPLGDRIARRDLKRAALKWQPSAFAMVRALTAAQLLVPPDASGSSKVDPDLRCLRPRWLLSLLKARATTTLVHHSSLDWGRVLVRGHEADRVISALISAAKRGDFSPFFRIFEDFDAEQLESIAALEGATIAVGLLLLTHDDVPEEVLSGIAQFTAETAIVLGAELLPRTVAADHAAQHFALSTWQVAVACVCRELPFPLQHLDPFRSEDPARVLPFITQTQVVLLAQVARLTCDVTANHERATVSRLLLGTLTLLSELLDVYAARSTKDAAHQLEPAYLQLIRDWENAPLLATAHEQVPLFLLVNYAETRGQKRAQILASLWQVLGRAPSLQKYFMLAGTSSEAALVTGGKLGEGQTHPEDELYAQFWEQLPPTTLQLRHAEGLSIAWRYIRPHQFSAWLGLTARDIELPPLAIQYCPLDAALTKLDSHGPRAFSRATLAAFVERAPGRFAERLGRYLGEPEQLTHFLEACPAAASTTFASLLPPADQLLRHTPSVVDAIRAFLIRAVRERHTHFEQSYARLAEIEQRLWPLRRIP